jgi:2-methylcitrate dehydratase PrpD
VNIAERFSDFTVKLEFQQLPQAIVKTAKLFFLDWLGAAFRGAEETSTQMSLEAVLELKGSEESTVLADMSRNSCIMAALANGISSHAVEMDDVHRKGIYHPGGPVFSAILPLAERLNASGRRFIEAAVAGYEVGVRSAVAVGKSHYGYWHTTGTCGTFGAAAGAAKLLSLNQQQTAWALGSAGTQAAGLWEFLADSAMSKQLHPAKAAVNGLLSAFLARKGFTGATSIYEGDKGFFRATSTDFDPAAAMADLGNGRYKISECSIKKHASCGHTHSAVDAVLDLVIGHAIVPADIVRINVRLYKQAVDLLEKITPTTPFFAKFCFPFCIASAVIFHQVGLEAFTDERIHDPAILGMMDRVSLACDKELTPLFPEKFSAIVTIETSHGELLTTRVDDPKGTPENPMFEEEIIEKYRRMAAGFLPKGKTERILKRVLNIEDFQSMDRFFH